MNVSVLPNIFCQQFSKTNNFEAKFNFPLRSLTPSDSQSPTILLIFLSSELLLLLQSLPLNWQILIFSFDFDITFHCTANNYSWVDLSGFCDHLRDIPWKIIIKLGASAAPCEWDQVEIDVYISLTVNMMLHLVHLHGFQLFVLLL